MVQYWTGNKTKPHYVPLLFNVFMGNSIRNVCGDIGVKLVGDINIYMFLYADGGVLMAKSLRNLQQCYTWWCNKEYRSEN